MDLPPRLSTQQRFALAWLADAEDGDEPVDVSRLSWALAREFGGYVDRRERARSIAEDSGDLQVPGLLGTIYAGLADEWLTPEHRAAFSRSLARLEDRGLVRRLRYANTRAVEGETWTNHRTDGVTLTDDGREVGREVLRRQRDGRYSLAFEALAE